MIAIARSGILFAFAVLPALFAANPIAAQTCPTAPASDVYGYALTYPTAADGCASGQTARFKTLELAEQAAARMPGTPWATGEMAFPVVRTTLAAPLVTQAQSGGFALDYRPNAALSAATSPVVYYAPETLYPPSFVAYDIAWPPSGGCSSCSDAHGRNYCGSIAAEIARVSCELNATWTHAGYAWQTDGSATAVNNITSATTLTAVKAAGFADPAGLGRNTADIVIAPNHSANYTGSGAWISIPITPRASTGTDPVPVPLADPTSSGLSPNDSGASTLNLGVAQHTPGACPAGSTVNTAAASQGGMAFACSTGFFKFLIGSPPITQTDSCHGKGDPCYPGNGNSEATEPGFEYGRIRLNLTYNSLRQLRTYAGIDKNWSHSFAQRILTSALVPDPSNVVDILVQNERAHIDDFVPQASGPYAGAYVSSNNVGDVLRIENTYGGYYDLYRADGRLEVFDVSGRVIAIVDRDDPRNTLSVTYRNNGDTTLGEFWRTARVADGTGRSVTFNYDMATTDARLSSIASDSGVTLLTFGYENFDFGRIATHRLKQTTRQDDSGALTATRTYLYNEAGHILNAASNPLPYHLTGILDEAGQRYFTAEFDDWGRATASWLGSSGADKYTLSYTDSADPASHAILASYVTIQSPLADTETYSYTNGQPYRKPDTIATGAGLEQLTYDAALHQVNKKIDRRGFETDYEYADGVHQTATVEAVGQPERRRTETDWSGNAAFNRLHARRVFNAAGTLETESDRIYNARGQLIARCDYDPLTIDPASYPCGSRANAPNGVRQTTYAYCEAADVPTSCPLLGLLKRIDGARTDVSDTTDYAYYTSTDVSGCGAATGPCYRAGDLKQVTDALGHATQFLVYDAAGRVLRTLDMNGTYTDLTYYPRGWLRTRSVRGNADGSARLSVDATTTFAYDSRGNIAQVTQADGSFLHYIYDDANRLTDVYDSQTASNYALGNHVRYTPDAAGHRIQEDTSDAAGTVAHTLSRQYDQLSHLVQSLNAGGYPLQHFVNPTDPIPVGSAAPYRNGYDFNGNPVNSLDGNSVDTEQKYDPLNRLVLTLQDHGGARSINAQTAYTYDARDNLLSVNDPDGLTTRYSYDGLGNLAKLQSPDTGTTVYSYDNAGNRAAQVDARGVASTYSYDALNRLTSIAYPTASLGITYTYDTPATGCYNTGRLTQMTDSSGSTTYCYDRRGNLLNKRQVTNGTALTTAYTYSRADRLASITYPSGAFVAYLRDTDGRIQSVRHQTSLAATPTVLVGGATYYPFGPLNVLTFGSGRTLTKTYDRDYLIDSVASSDPNGFVMDAGMGVMGSPLTASRTLGQATPDIRFQYDRLYRLSTVMSGTTPLFSFTYTPAGDRTSATPQGQSTRSYAYAAGTHRLASIDGVQRNYDANGNTTYSASLDTATYDDRNRMTAAAGIQFDYNGRGERVFKTGTLYSYDESGHLLGEYSPTGAMRAEYVYLDETPVGYVSSGTVYYIETDQLGTPRSVVKPGATSAADTVVWKWDYFASNSAFGENAPNAMGVVFNLRFPGQYYDLETGLSYNYFRDYEPGTGRYVESDPIGLRGGFATYSYAHNQALKWIDARGLVADSPIDEPDKCGRRNPDQEPPLYYSGLTYCDGGQIVPRSCDNTCTGVCTQAHEDSHKQWAVQRYGAGICMGRRRGTTPFPVWYMNDRQYRAAADSSQCAAMLIERECLKKLKESGKTDCPNCKIPYERGKDSNDRNIEKLGCGVTVF